MYRNYTVCVTCTNFVGDMINNRYKDNWNSELLPALGFSHCTERVTVVPTDAIIYNDLDDPRGPVEKFYEVSKHDVMLS